MSVYLMKLDSENPDVAIRYRQKISLINNVDPFCLEEDSLSYNPEDFPLISNVDIVSYLVLSTSYYTKQQMKAYKSLNAFKYFEAGFVSSCGTCKVADYILVLGKMKHSQRMNLPLRVWVVCSVDGSVETAHCTCMAGAGEVCSHVGALLYAVEYIVSTKSNTSCTDVCAMWKVPSITKVEYKRIKDIHFGKTVSYAKVDDDSVPALTSNEISKLLEDVQTINLSTPLMRIVEPFASEIANEMQSEIIIRNVYSDIYKSEYEACTYEELLNIASCLEIKLSSEDCKKIQEITLGQANSEQWFIQRAGRITASKFKQACNTSLKKPSLSLIKMVCYPLKFNFKTKATEWGKSKESVAILEYKNYQNVSHEHLDVKNVGLCITEEFPQFGASPDALVDCSCCGQGCVEVKCPYLLKDKTIAEFSALPNTCLIYSEDNLQLSRQHAYFYQIQQQMAITGTTYCDFVVWSPKEMFIERIPFNEDFWFSESQKSLNFHQNVIMPELLGRYFTKSNIPLATYCLCKTIDDGRPMIKCDDDDCVIEWYHMECVNLIDVPSFVWICPSCK